MNIKPTNIKNSYNKEQLQKKSKFSTLNGSTLGGQESLPYGSEYTKMNLLERIYKDVTGKTPSTAKRYIYLHPEDEFNPTNTQKLAEDIMPQETPKNGFAKLLDKYKNSPANANEIDHTINSDSFIHSNDIQHDNFNIHSTSGDTHSQLLDNIQDTSSGQGIHDFYDAIIDLLTNH